MASYLMQLSYSSEAWAALVKHQENRVEAVRKVVEKLGGSITGFWIWLAFWRCRTTSTQQLSPSPSLRAALAEMSKQPL
jgi:hypothetical protein